SQAQRGSSATGQPSPSRETAHQLPPATSSDHDRHTGTYRRGRNAGRPGGNLVPEHASMGARRVRRAVPGATLVPVSTRFDGPEALDVIARGGASVLIVADRFLGTDRLAALRTAAAAAEAANARASTENPTAAKRNLPGGPVTPGNCASWSACRCR